MMLIVNYLAGRIFMNKEFLADKIRKSYINGPTKFLIENCLSFPTFQPFFIRFLKKFHEKIQY